MKFQIFILSILSAVIISCKGGGGHSDQSQLQGPDTLKVVTLYGPTSYFLYRGDEMGIEYENVKRFAEAENMILDIKTTKNISELINLLKNGEAHLAAYPVPFIAEYNSEIIHCGPKEISWQVLVQRNGTEKLSDVTSLVGKDVYVEKDSKFQYRMENLNEEIGGGINIIPLENDTISSEDLLKMVNDGIIDYAVVDSDIAEINKSDFPKLDTSLHLSLEQTASWAVAPGLDSLANRIDKWERNYHDSPVLLEIYKRYYDRGKYDKVDADLAYFIDKYGNNKPVSPYENIFRQYAAKSGFDWKFLAAIAFCESRFQPEAQSRFGATGIMQIMPSSAAAVGVNPGLLTNPESNVSAAVKILSRMNQSLEKKIEDPEERMKFLLASYNSGLGHVFDSMALAEKHGLDPSRWIGNVSVAVLMKSRPEFFNDPVVKHGYFRGRETVDFVDKVMSVYSYLESNIKNKI